MPNHDSANEPHLLIDKGGLTRTVDAAVTPSAASAVVHLSREDQETWAKLNGGTVFSEGTMREVRHLTEPTLRALTNLPKAAVLHADAKSPRVPVIGPSLKI